MTSIIKDGACRLENGTINGNTHDLGFCVRQAIRLGIPPEAAWKMASWNPAKVIGADQLMGSIQVGKQADLVVTDENWNIKTVFQNGTAIIENLESNYIN